MTNGHPIFEWLPGVPILDEDELEGEDHENDELENESLLSEDDSDDDDSDDDDTAAPEFLDAIDDGDSNDDDDSDYVDDTHEEEVDSNEDDEMDGDEDDDDALHRQVKHGYHNADASGAVAEEENDTGHEGAPQTRSDDRPSRSQTGTKKTLCSRFQSPVLRDAVHGRA